MSPDLLPRHPQTQPQPSIQLPKQYGLLHTYVFTTNYDAMIAQARPKSGLIETLSAGTPGQERLDESRDANIWYLRKKLDKSPDRITTAIAIDQGIMHGNPIFRGTRIPVYQIIEELADGTPLNELPESFPALGPEKIQAGLDFAVRLLRVFDE